MIKFKSIPKYYYKEQKGIKNNTLRKVDNDIRFRKLKDYSNGTINDLTIRILKSTDIQEYFERQIKDVTFYEDWCIITWRA